MTDDVGYGKPPLRTRFKPGASGNPKGRPKKAPDLEAEIIDKQMATIVTFREHGITKSAPRFELSIKALISKAIKGDVRSAEMLLDLREHVERHGSKRDQRIIVTDWLPEYDGQTAEQKTRDAAQQMSIGLTAPPKTRGEEPD